MKIKILGNGGAVSDGLSYNSFIIDGKALVETPPDIIISIFRENVQLSSIEEIYISHTHGDHTFGFPLLVLRMFIEAKAAKRAKPLKIFLPKNGIKYLFGLTGMALSKKHPSIKWIKENFDFIILKNMKEFRLLDYAAVPYRMDHIEETYGFLLRDAGRTAFAYSADTRWCENLENIIKEKPRAILLDLNGEKNDLVKIHLSEDDIINNGPGIAAPETKFFGTHLKYQKESAAGGIVYVKPGMVIEA